MGDLAGFSIKQEAALSVCDARREATVAIIDGVNAVTHPRPWWRVW